MIAVGAGIVDAGGAPLGAVREGGLEAVVAVGEHEAGAGDRGADRRDALRVVDAPQRVVDAVLVGGGGDGRGGVGIGPAQQRREPGGEGEPPDRVEVGPGRAQQLEPVALRLRQRALVRQHVARRLVAEPERADHPGGALRAGRRRPVKSMR